MDSKSLNKKLRATEGNKELYLNLRGEGAENSGVNRDISFRKQAMHQQEKMMVMIEGSPDFIVFMNINGNILYQNPAALQMLGTHEEDCISIAALHPKWGCDLIFDEGIPMAIEKGVWKGETSILKHDGTEIPVSQVVVAHKSESGKVEFLSSVSRDITERKELETMVKRQALYDVVTNLPNRRYLYQKLSQTIANSIKEQRFAIMFIDLDGFKAINDTFGHQIGDMVLDITASRLKSCVRKYDFISRFAGDEFIILLENIEALDVIKQVAGRIVETFHQPFYLAGHKIKVTVSIGVSLYPDHGSDEETLINKADQAMYQIKRQRKIKSSP